MSTTDSPNSSTETITQSTSPHVIEINTYLDFNNYTLEDIEKAPLENIKGTLSEEILKVALEVYEGYEKEYYIERVKRLKGNQTSV